MLEGKLKQLVEDSSGNFFSSFFLRSMIITDPEFKFAHFEIKYNDKRYRGTKDPEDLIGHITIGGVRYNDMIYYCVSFCSPEDNFSRGLGRKIALAHMTDNNCNMRGAFSIKPGDSELLSSTLLEGALISHIEKCISKRTIPVWIKRAAENKNTIVNRMSKQKVKMS